jgi:hypothetical protein
LYFRVVVAVVAAGVLVTGCGDGKNILLPTHGTSPSAAPAAAKTLTETQARAILARYVRVNNEANAKVSDPLLRSIETGPMLEGDLVYNKRIRAKQENKIKPFYYQKYQFYIPRNVAPAWFGVLATSGKDKEFLIFVDAGGGAYKSAAASWLDEGQKMPAIAHGADGAATSVTTGPALGVGIRFAAYLTTAAAGKGLTAGFKSGRTASRIGKDWAMSVRRNTGSGYWSGGVKWKARPQPVYALKTADGGAVVVNSTNQSESYTAVKSNVWFQPNSIFFGLGPKRYYHQFTGYRLWEFITYVAPHGSASVLGYTVQSIKATGS